MKHLIALLAALTMTACAGNAKHTDDTLYYLCDNNEKGKLDFEDEILVITRTPEGEYKGKFYGTSDEFMKARKGFLPGFYALPFAFRKGESKEISFTLSAKDRRFLNMPVSIKYQNHFDAIDAFGDVWYLGWKQSQDILDKEVVTFCGELNADGIVLENRDVAFPEKKRLFKRVKADELAAYGAQLMTRKQSKENSGRLYPVQGRSGKVVELSNGNFYPLIEKDEEQGCYVLDGQEYSKVPMDKGTVREYRAEDGKGFIYLTKNITIHVYDAPSAGARKISILRGSSHEVPECYQVLSYQNGWYKIRIEGAAGNKISEGYVPEKHFSWDPKGF